jgi:dipeptidyl-peptidase-3
MAPARVPDPRAVTHRLEIKHVFDSLPHKDKLYAHHLGKAAWKGSRIIMRQTSPESEDIFDLIISLYHSCDGDWGRLIDHCNVSEDELNSFLAYAGLFLYNMGNFYVCHPIYAQSTLSRL